MTSNVKGVMGKKKFDEKRLSYIQTLTFENYPCAAAEQKNCWSKCVKAIDSASRSLCRQKIKTEKEQQLPV